MSYDAPEVFRKDNGTLPTNITQLLGRGGIWHRCGADEWVTKNTGMVRTTKQLFEDYAILAEHPSSLSYTEALIAAYERDQPSFTSTDKD